MLVLDGVGDVSDWLPHFFAGTNAGSGLRGGDLGGLVMLVADRLEWRRDPGDPIWLDALLGGTTGLVDEGGDWIWDPVASSWPLVRSSSTWTKFNAEIGSVVNPIKFMVVDYDSRVVI